MKIIVSQHELMELATELGVRTDWHEPDERDLTARVEGVSFDNAGFWPAGRYSAEIVEQHVILSQNGHDAAAINLATLLAWASEPR